MDQNETFQLEIAERNKSGIMFSMLKPSRKAK